MVIRDWPFYATLETNLPQDLGCCCCCTCYNADDVVALCLWTTSKPRSQQCFRAPSSWMPLADRLIPQPLPASTHWIFLKLTISSNLSKYILKEQIWLDKDQETSTPQISVEVICVLDFILDLSCDFDLGLRLLRQLYCIIIVISDGLAKHWKFIGFTWMVWLDSYYSKQWPAMSRFLAFA